MGFGLGDIGDFFSKAKDLPLHPLQLNKKGLKKTRKELGLEPPDVKINMPEEKAMPTPDDEAIKLARRRQIARMQARTGRLSTILTSNRETLG